MHVSSEASCLPVGFLQSSRVLQRFSSFLGPCPVLSIAVLLLSRGLSLDFHLASPLDFHLPWAPSNLLLAPRSPVRALVLLLGCPGTCMITGGSSPHLFFQVLDRLRRQVDFLSQRVDRLERRLGTCERRAFQAGFRARAAIETRTPYWGADLIEVRDGPDP